MVSYKIIKQKQTDRQTPPPILLIRKGKIKTKKQMIISGVKWLLCLVHICSSKVEGQFYSMLIILVTDVFPLDLETSNEI